MTVIWGVLLAVVFFFAGWIFIEIPISLILAGINKRQGGQFDVQFASRGASIVMAVIEIGILVAAALALGVPAGIVQVAAGVRFVFALVAGG